MHMAAARHAAMIQGADGAFYGTTLGGGANGDGTVFRLTTNGAIAALASFNLPERRQAKRAAPSRQRQLLWHNLRRRHQWRWHSLSNHHQWRIHQPGLVQLHQRRLSSLCRPDANARWQFPGHDLRRRDLRLRHGVSNFSRGRGDDDLLVYRRKRWRSSRRRADSRQRRQFLRHDGLSAALTMLARFSGWLPTARWSLWRNSTAMMARIPKPR